MDTYRQTLDFLYQRLPMFSRIGAAAFKADLTNTLALCKALGDPHLKFKSVHIAGTNGKGSTSHMLAAILQQAGYRTGLYTSPHLKDFRERIKVNGEMIDEDFVVDFTNRIKPFIDRIEPSFFEITVAMAFDWFTRQQVDIAVIEVGLGGRLDSTNVITPLVSVITNIGYDHMNILGDTLPQIAGEKAGIIKANTPVVVGKTLPETRPVFLEKAAEMKAPIFFAAERLWIASWQPENHYLNVTVADKANDERRQYLLDLPGIYQTDNLLAVLETVTLLKQQGFVLTNEHISAALKDVRKLTGLEGRWQIIHQKPLMVLDVGHNEDGIKQIVAQLEHCTFNRLHIVFGMVKDKDPAHVLSLLPGYAQYYFTNASIPRALPAAELAAMAQQYGLQGTFYSKTMEAVQKAVDHAHPGDMILVCGSVFLVGEVDREAIKW